MSGGEDVLARATELYEKYSNGDVDGLAAGYTENAVLYVNEQDPIVGREAIKESLTKLADVAKTMDLEKWDYFEQFNDNTAYSLVYTKCLDASGAVFGRYKGCFLWRKIDGTWFIEHDIFNELPK